MQPVLVLMAKINMAVDSCGLAIDFIIMGDRVHDSKAAPSENWYSDDTTQAELKGLEWLY